MPGKSFIPAEYFLKNMYSKCCIRLLFHEFQDENIHILEIRIGYLKIEYDSTSISDKNIVNKLNQLGLEVIVSKEQRIVAEIKQAVFELIHEMNGADSIARKSEYMVEKLNMSYQQISKIFSKQENSTLERYIILNKLEKIKDLIDSEEYTLSEIAYLMDYSSVQYLSNQFKKEVGYSVSEYKERKIKPKIPLEELGKRNNIN